MESFGVIAFIFGLCALGIATTNTTRVTKLKEELDGLKKEIEELLGERE